MNAAYDWLGAGVSGNGEIVQKDAMRSMPRDECESDESPLADVHRVDDVAGTATDESPHMLDNHRLTIRLLAEHDAAQGVEAVPRVTSPCIPSASGSEQRLPWASPSKRLRDQGHSSSVWIPKKHGAGRCNWGTLDEICRESARSYGDWCQTAIDYGDLNYEADDEEYVLEEIPVASETNCVSLLNGYHAALKPNAVDELVSASYMAQGGSPITCHGLISPRKETGVKPPESADAAWEENGFSYGTRCSDLYLS
jgi:hypothetical protein